jgi:hypothetical protein
VRVSTPHLCETALDALNRGVMLFGAHRVHVRASAARSVLSLAEKLSDADVCEWHELATSAMVDAIAVAKPWCRARATWR